MRILGDIEKAPLEGGRCGVGSCSKQVHSTMKEVVLIIVVSVDIRFLKHQRLIRVERTRDKGNED